MPKCVYCGNTYNIPRGLTLVKNDGSINYLCSSKFSISAKAKNFKEAEHIVQNALSNIEKKAKEKKAFFEIKEK